MAALEQGSAAKKIGMRAAQSASRAQLAAASGFKEIRNENRVSLPGPAAAGLAMQLSGDPALRARFLRLQKATASALNTASRQGRDLSKLQTPLPTLIGEHPLGH